ncbi:MAG TPA: tetratricopeptide repeat protein, partial [Blastocatellia bacterium]|nr:tetratricopeptide repeat protein [Blastocatellia bacterium]
ASLAKQTRKNPAQLQRANDLAFRSLLLTSMLVRARNLEDRGMLVDAANLYRSILSEFPDQRPSQMALDRIENILADRERDERVRVAREEGLRKFRLGDYAGAEPDLTVAVDAGRTDTATLYALGMSHLRLKNYSQALMVLNSCIAANPDYAPALVGLAQVKLFAGEKEQALALLNRALELGGGAEFTPAKIRDMISSLNSKVSALPARPPRNPS